MKREILFRGQRIDNGEWVYGSLLVDCDNSRMIIPSGKGVFAGEEVKPETVSQFTGLKDNNGVEIYEGDIIDIHQTVNGVSTFVILSCIGGYDVRYYYENKPQREYEYSIYELLDIGKTEKELEIIGNIHNK